MRKHQKPTSIFFLPILFGLSSSFIWGDIVVLFSESLFLCFSCLAKGSQHIAHKVLKSLWAADGYQGNALRIRRWYCGKHPVPLNITFSSFVANIAEERDYKSSKSWGLNGEVPLMFSFGLNDWPRLLNKERKHFTKKNEVRKGGKEEEEEKMHEKYR